MGALGSYSSVVRRGDADSAPGVEEVPLLGGRITPGVVRVAATVRRPLGPRSTFVHGLLSTLEQAGFAAAPRFLGIDDRGREVLSYIEGFVPDNLDADFTDAQLAAAAQLLRRYHDTTAGTALAAGQECVCHNDISPVNTVFANGQPVALIDFDMARPGSRIRDVSYGAFLWLNLGWDGRPPDEQRRRLRLWCEEYGPVNSTVLVSETKARVRETVERRRHDGAEDAARWWHRQLAWLERHEREIEP